MTSHDGERKAWLTLLRAPRLGAARMRALLERCPDVHAALELALDAPGLTTPTRQWLSAPDTARLDADMAWLNQPGHHLLTCNDADFPPLLSQIPDPPVALFIAGQTDWLLKPQLAVVGARRATAAGRADAACLSAALARAGFVITSGLAHGIDGAAHRAALDAGGGTIAVMGTGPDRIYPAAHRSLAARIEQAGALVSEWVPGTKPLPYRFPQRNRIIAGLSLGTLVVEAGVRSGSLITARQAAGQGREVFALPGSVHNPLARGCHRLIRDGAVLVETVDDIVAELGPLAHAAYELLAERLDDGDVRPDVGVPEPKTAVGPAGHEADESCQRLLEAMPHGQPIAADTLGQRLNLSAANVSILLLQLELDGRVASEVGGVWMRLP